MSKKQFAVVLASVVIAGFMGGMAAELMFRPVPALAGAEDIQTITAETVKAKSFYVVDRRGKTLAAFGAERGGPSLQMFGTGKQPQLQLTVGGNGPSLTMYHSPNAEPIVLDRRGLVGMNPQPSP